MSLMDMHGKWTIEEFLEVHFGYFLNFSDQPFVAFTHEGKNIEVHSYDYTTHGPPKAKQRVGFLDVNSVYLVRKLLNGLIGKNVQGYGIVQALANQHKLEASIDCLYGNFELMPYQNFRGSIGTEQVSKR